MRHVPHPLACVKSEGGECESTIWSIWVFRFCSIFDSIFDSVLFSHPSGPSSSFHCSHPVSIVFYYLRVTPPVSYACLFKTIVGYFVPFFVRMCIWIFHKVSGKNDSTNVIGSKVSFKRIFSRYGTHYMFHINFFCFF